MFQDDLELLAMNSSPVHRKVLPLKRAAAAVGPVLEEPCPSPAQQYTEEALKDLFVHVHLNMPDSAKKKKLVRQVSEGGFIPLHSLVILSNESTVMQFS